MTFLLWCLELWEKLRLIRVIVFRRNKNEFIYFFLSFQALSVQIELHGVVLHKIELSKTSIDFPLLTAKLGGKRGVQNKKATLQICCYTLVQLVSTSSFPQT